MENINNEHLARLIMVVLNDWFLWWIS